MANKEAPNPSGINEGAHMFVYVSPPPQEPQNIQPVVRCSGSEGRTSPLTVAAIPPFSIIQEASSGLAQKNSHNNLAGISYVQEAMDDSPRQPKKRLTNHVLLADPDFYFELGHDRSLGTVLLGSKFMKWMISHYFRTVSWIATVLFSITFTGYLYFLIQNHINNNVYSHPRDNTNADDQQKYENDSKSKDIYVIICSILLSVSILHQMLTLLLADIYLLRLSLYSFETFFLLLNLAIQSITFICLHMLPKKDSADIFIYQSPSVVAMAGILMFICQSHGTVCDAIPRSHKRFEKEFRAFVELYHNRPSFISRIRKLFCLSLIEMYFNSKRISTQSNNVTQDKTLAADIYLSEELTIRDLRRIKSSIPTLSHSIHHLFDSKEEWNLWDIILWKFDIFWTFSRWEYFLSITIGVLVNFGFYIYSKDTLQHRDTDIKISILWSTWTLSDIFIATSLNSAVFFLKKVVSYIIYPLQITSISRKNLTIPLVPQWAVYLEDDKELYMQLIRKLNDKNTDNTLPTDTSSLYSSIQGPSNPSRNPAEPSKVNEMIGKRSPKQSDIRLEAKNNFYDKRNGLSLTIKINDSEELVCEETHHQTTHPSPKKQAWNPTKNDDQQGDSNNDGISGQPSSSIPRPLHPFSAEPRSRANQEETRHMSTIIISSSGKGKIINFDVTIATRYLPKYMCMFSRKRILPFFPHVLFLWVIGNIFFSFYMVNGTQWGIYYTMVSSTLVIIMMISLFLNISLEAAKLSMLCFETLFLLANNLILMYFLCQYLGGGSMVVCNMVGISMVVSAEIFLDSHPIPYAHFCRQLESIHPHYEASGPAGFSFHRIIQVLRSKVMLRVAPVLLSDVPECIRQQDLSTTVTINNFEATKYFSRKFFRFNLHLQNLYRYVPLAGNMIGLLWLVWLYCVVDFDMAKNASHADTTFIYGKWNIRSIMKTSIVNITVFVLKRIYHCFVRPMCSMAFDQPLYALPASKDLLRFCQYRLGSHQQAMARQQAPV